MIQILPSFYELSSEEVQYRAPGMYRDVGTAHSGPISFWQLTLVPFSSQDWEQITTTTRYIYIHIVIPYLKDCFSQPRFSTFRRPLYTIVIFFFLVFDFCFDKNTMACYITAHKVVKFHSNFSIHDRSISEYAFHSLKGHLYIT